jgi:hypothetical protein
MEQRFRVLRIISTIYKVLGGLAALLTVIIIIGGCLTSIFGGAVLGSLFNGRGGGSGLLGGVVGGLIQAFIVAVISLIYGGGAAVTLYAFGEGIELVLSLEENTRTTATLLQRQIGGAGAGALASDNPSPQITSNS